MKNTAVLFCAALSFVLQWSALSSAQSNLKTTQIAAGSVHNCALLSNGTVRCWGDNTNGQLGDGTTTARDHAVPVHKLTNATMVTTGDAHSCALLSDQTVRCWGSNIDGELGDGTTTDRSTPVQVVGLTSVVEISAGSFHTCARRADGTMRCWGSNLAGQLGSGGGDSTVPVAVSGISNAVSIGTGTEHSCAVLADGTGRCWGTNDYGQLGNNAGASAIPSTVVGLSGAKTIALGSYHSCAVLNSGAARCWGSNYSGILGDNTTTDRPTPVAVSGLSSGVLAMTAYESHTCALKSNGSAYCWGDNQYGKLGTGIIGNAEYKPVLVTNATDILQIAVGVSHTCALSTGGFVRCWGYNGPFETLGSPTASTYSALPLTVHGLPIPPLAVPALDLKSSVVLTLSLLALFALAYRRRAFAARA